MFQSASKALLSFYRLLISPALHLWAGPGTGCRFEPSCSHYATEAIQRFGAWNGGVLTVRRFLCCNPFNANAGFDPVPHVMKRNSIIIRKL